jgi:hypothetical protein
VDFLDVVGGAYILLVPGRRAGAAFILLTQGSRSGMAGVAYILLREEGWCGIEPVGLMENKTSHIPGLIFASSKCLLTMVDLKLKKTYIRHHRKQFLAAWFDETEK